MKKIYGIGTGPGAADLLTLRGVKAMEESDIIFVPYNKGKNMALDTAKEFIENKKIVYIDFPMGRVKREHYIDAANTIYNSLGEDEIGSFLTIGDPMIYSTFIYIVDELRDMDIEIEIVPGIPSFVASAAAAQIPLTEKGDNFVLCDELNQDILKCGDSVAILKTFKDKTDILNILEDNDYSYTYIKRASLEDELILNNREDILEEKDYISLILGKKKDTIEE